jgi:hypothetical protein
MEKLREKKTPMDKLNDIIDWEIFRPILEENQMIKEKQTPLEGC